MEAEELLYERFIVPLEGRSAAGKRVGVEFEFPLLNLTGKANKQLVEFLFAGLLQRGFSGIYKQGELRALEREHEVTLSLDTSYNNLEAAFYPQQSILQIAAVWERVLAEIKEIIRGRGLIFALGINPLSNILPADFIADAECEAERDFLRTYSVANRECPADFFAFISSIQTNLEFNLSDLPQAMNVFSSLDFAEIMLFANSPLRTREGWFRSGRHYLYSRSAFYPMGLSGSIDERFSSVSDILRHYAERSLFLRWRQGKCGFVSPVPLKEYCRDSSYQAERTDLRCFYSYRNTELKSRGTLERRIACTQPFAELFAPVAFAVGIAEKLSEAEELAEEFFQNNKIAFSNNQLCETAARGLLLWDSKILYDFLGSLWELARSGLKKRALGEEKYLNCFEDKFLRMIRWGSNADKKIK